MLTTRKDKETTPVLVKLDKKGKEITKIYSSLSLDDDRPDPYNDIQNLEIDESLISRLSLVSKDELKKAIIMRKPPKKAILLKYYDILMTAPAKDISTRKGETFYPCPNGKSSHSDNILVCGPSGSGKSYFTQKYVELFLQRSLCREPC